jgi:hypothetical protein
MSMKLVEHIFEAAASWLSPPAVKEQKRWKTKLLGAIGKQLAQILLPLVGVDCDWVSARFLLGGYMEFELFPQEWNSSLNTIYTLWL